MRDTFFIQAVDESYLARDKAPGPYCAVAWEGDFPDGIIPGSSGTKRHAEVALTAWRNERAERLRAAGEPSGARG